MRSFQGITDRGIDQAYSDLREVCGGLRNDYFGLLYLEQQYDLPRDKARNQIAFGGNDYGLDGFHFDVERRNLYLFQFKNSDSCLQFKGSLQRLIEGGMERIFISTNKDDSKNQLLLQLRSCMVENRAVIDQVCFHFVFTGDPAEAERSQVLDKLREDLENKKHFLDEFFFERAVTLVVEFRSAAGRTGGPGSTRGTHVYDASFSDLIALPGPAGELMHIGFIRLFDLHRIYSDMGRRFFERNIRYGLGEGEAVNRAISRALKMIVLDKTNAPEVFSFNHNGITMFAEKLEPLNGTFRLTEPRLLNGAQTVTTLEEFLSKNKENSKLEGGRQVLESLKVLCRIITSASQEFVTGVTINNNRQNPIEPWNLRANDLLQLVRGQIP
jgi:AIPR protein